jgi:hypothetical protein
MLSNKNSAGANRRQTRYGPEEPSIFHLQELNETSRLLPSETIVAGFLYRLYSLAFTFLQLPELLSQPSSR